MSRISSRSPNPNPPLNPDAAPYSPPPQPPAPAHKVGSSWVFSKPYHRLQQPVVYQLIPRAPPSSPPPGYAFLHQPSGEGSYVTSSPLWAHHPATTVYRLCYYHQYYYHCPKAAVVGPPVAPPAATPEGPAPGEAHQEPSGGKTGRMGGHATAAQPWLGRRESWVPKVGSGPHTAPCFGAKGKDKAVIDLHGRTSLMIKNVPNQYGRDNLMAIVDEHCLVENNKAMSDGQPVWSSYDFLYLPMDFVKRANLGYAFVNFTTEVGAERFWAAFNGFKWEVSRKTCEVSEAETQGKEGFLKRFRNSVFPCHTDNYLPVVFRPPRDGVIRSKPSTVGRRSGAFPCRPRKSSSTAGNRKRRVM